ncbi:hypothetical protein P10VF_131 [Rhizobium phage vB_RleM_P10VF]|uniref:Uncharacterized protein n=1 Tax=Rhizobium phage vB_RleM_P10VF TaxID=1527770 RepID=A0A076YNH6_9CAUD|nr:hypothetical protein P10VF_131 [Rhizobium phage vB_RleM_P10VF]AIK68344.1 hypothetical protein P10VF_131 [Rhizobium phage vB_RleM_P10VF]
MDKVAYIEDQLGGKFLRTSNGKQVFELSSCKNAIVAIKEIGARPFNFIEQDGEFVFTTGKKPSVTI